MKRLLVEILCIAVVGLCAADSPPLREETLKSKNFTDRQRNISGVVVGELNQSVLYLCVELSAAGEQYVDEEIKQTLLGVKQMKEMMEKKEEKHRHLMDALRHSSDKKKLAKETKQKLDEAEQKCRDLTKSSFGKCRPCVEESCKAFYTSTCRRGFASFSFKVEEFFRKMATQLEASEHVYNQNQENPDRTSSAEITEDKSNLDLLQAETSFSQLLSNISLLYDHSVTVIQKMQQVFGRSFQASFTSELQPGLLSAVQGEPSAGFLRTVGLDHIFDSVFDFGKNVAEKFSSSIADVFEEIHEAEEYLQQESPGGYLCLLLQSGGSNISADVRLFSSPLSECPSVQPLHSEMEEMNMLLNASRQQYDDRLQLVQRHTADTQKWLSSMEDKFGWISQLSSSTVEPKSIFSVISVSESTVVVSILDSTPITVLVPADLEVDDPAFIQFVAQEALTLHKRQIKGNDPTSETL
uniref:Clusterin n=1 Tax=Acanthochromis polyacanthus TaxID=80966 RepID=A0A3Q1F8A7_9TELE